MLLVLIGVLIYLQANLTIATFAVIANIVQFAANMITIIRGLGKE
jgi:hypothetical protein